MDKRRGAVALTTTRQFELFAHNSRINEIEIVVTNCTPLPFMEKLHTTICLVSSIKETDISFLWVSTKQGTVLSGSNRPADACDPHVLSVFTVVDTEPGTRTVNKPCLVTRAMNIVEPDSSAPAAIVWVVFNNFTYQDARAGCTILKHD
jgi:hypothetical protein